MILKRFGLPFHAGDTTVGGSFPLLVAPMNYESSLGAVDQSFSQLHSLQVISLGSVEADVTAVPFANIVVPTGTHFDLSGYLAGNMGSPQWIDVTDQSGGETALRLGRASADIPPISASDVPLPEPGSLGLTILASCLYLRRRSRRKSSRSTAIDNGLHLAIC